jgi:DNA transformation protein
MSDDELFTRVKTLLDGLDVQGRKMFGGIGIFSERIMFSLIYDRALYFRSTEEIASYYSTDSIQFQHPSKSSKMPYWSVTDQVINDKSKFTDWAYDAFHLAKSLRRKETT